MVLRGDVVAETSSVLLMKPFLIVLCLRHWAPHRCGDPDPFRTTGQTCEDFSNHLALNVSGKWVSMVLPLYFGKLSAWDLMTKAAIMKRGYTYVLLIRTEIGPIKLITTGTFATRNDLRVLDMVLESEISVKFWATIRSQHERATTCASLVPVTLLAHHHEVTWWALMSSPDCHMWGEFRFHPFLSFPCVIFHHEHHVHQDRLNKNIRRIEFKPNTQLSSTWRLVTRWREDHLEWSSLIRDTLNQEKHDKVTDPTSAGKTRIRTRIHKTLRFDNLSCWKWSNRNGETRHGRSKRGVPGLSHSAVKEAEHLRVQELVKRIEIHPYRDALQADLQQNNVHNPFSKDSEEMIRKLCTSCAKQFQKYNVVNVFSIGIKEWSIALADSSWFAANPEEIFEQTKIGCTPYPGLRDKEGRYPSCSTWQDQRTKRVPYSLQRVEEMLQESWLSRWTFYRHSWSIFLRDPVYRDSQLAIGWSEQKCKEWDELSKEDHYIISLQRKRIDTKDIGILLWTNQAKMYLWSFDLITEPLS